MERVGLIYKITIENIIDGKSWAYLSRISERMNYH